MGVPAHRNLLCLEEKRPPEREGPRERRGEGAEVRGGARGHSRPRRSMQKTQAGDTEMKGVGQRPGGPEKRGGRGEEKADQARWVCEFLSSTAPPQPGSSHLWPSTHCPTARTSLSVVSTSVLSLERASLTCTRIWKAGWAVSPAGGRTCRPSQAPASLG